MLLEQPIYEDIASTLSVAQKILEERGSTYGHEPRHRTVQTDTRSAGTRPARRRSQFDY